MEASPLPFFHVRPSLVIIPSLAIVLLAAVSLSRPLVLLLWKWLSTCHPRHSHRGAALAAPVRCSEGAVDGQRGGHPRSPAPAVTAAERCIFCLCDLENGEEVRELRCGHVFHGSCLDTWAGSGRVTCPLCRRSLAGEGEEASEPPCDEDEVELGVVALMFMLHLPYAWWPQ